MSASIENEPSPQERPFQFGVRTLFLGVSVACSVLGVMAYLETVWSVVFAWSMLLIGAHVLGNAWGTNPHHYRRQHDAADSSAPSAPIEFAPATRLRASTRFGIWMLLATACGAVLGGLSGTFALANSHLDRVGEVGTAIGGISSAILGGFFGFLAAGFVEVFGRAFREASREQIRRTRT